MLSARVESRREKSPNALDLVIAITKDGAPIGRQAKATFAKNPKFPNLRGHERLSDPLGRIPLKGLLVGDFHEPLRLSIEGGPELGLGLYQGALAYAFGAMEGGTPQGSPGQAGQAGNPGSIGDIALTTEPGGKDPGFLETEALRALTGMAGAAASSQGRDGSDGRGVASSGQGLGDAALSRGSAMASNALSGWFGKYGKARVSLGVNRKGRFTGQADFLYPFLERDKFTGFAQAGVRLDRGRSVANLGLGARFGPYDGYLFGANAFLDRDFSGGHTRGGLGAELWKGPIRASSNLYVPLTGFKGSKLREGLLERPASGWDLRLNGKLPFYERITASLGYERWTGSFLEGEGLYSSPSPVRSPKGTLSYGLSYTPVDWLTVEARHGTGGAMKGFSGRVLVNLDIPKRDTGTGSSAGAINASRDPLMLAERASFVDRRYDMPMEYKAAKNYLIRLVGSEGAKHCFRVSNGIGVAWPWTDAKAFPISPGFQVQDLASGVAKSDFVTDGSGLFCLMASPEPGVATGVVRVEAGDASEDFELGFGNDPPITPDADKPVRVAYIGPEGESHLFRTVDDKGFMVPRVNVGVSPDDPRVTVLDHNDRTPKGSFLSDDSGYFRLALSSSDPTVSKVTLALVPEGNDASYADIALAYSLRLSASPLSLDYLKGTDVLFALELDGAPLEEGADVTFEADETLLGGVAGLKTLGPQGRILVPGVLAKGLGSLGPVKARHKGLRSNGLTFTGVGAVRYTLEADKDSLEEGNPTQVVFTLLKDGAKVPPGTQASFQGETLTGFQNPYLVSDFGKVTVPGLTALAGVGHAYAKATIDGSDTNKVGFALSAKPTPPEGVLSLQASPLELAFLESQDITLVPLFDGGKIAKGTSLGILNAQGEFQNLPSALATDDSGHLRLTGVVPVKLGSLSGMRVSLGGKPSNEVFFEVKDDGAYTLRASTDSLPWGLKSPVSFTVLRNGVALPVGSEVRLEPLSQGELGGIGGVFATDGQGGFTATGVEPLAKQGPLAVKALVNGKGTNYVGFEVTGVPADILALTANPQNIPYMEDATVVFGISLNGEPLPSGEGVSFHYAGGRIARLPVAATLSILGEISVSAVMATAVGDLGEIRVSRSGIYSNPVSLTGVADGDLALSADRDRLPFLEGALVTFTILYNGSPLPAGTQVELLPRDAGSLEGLAGTHVTDSLGHVTIPSLTAKSPEGPLLVYAKAIGKVSQEASFQVDLVGPLGLTASTDSLPFLEDAPVGFQVTLKGEPLPKGMSLGYVLDGTQLETAGSSATSQEGGKFQESLKAMAPGGPIPFSVRLGSLVSNDVTFKVAIDGTKVTMDLLVFPEIKDQPSYLGIANLVAPCQSFDLTMAFAYKGSPMANVPLSVTGLGLSSPAGPVTDQYGRLFATIWYDDSFLPGYQSDPNYRVSVGDLVLSLPGPYPMGFASCN
jgi:hypothetical protein